LVLPLSHVLVKGSSALLINIPLVFSLLMRILLIDIQAALLYGGTELVICFLLVFVHVLIVVNARPVSGSCLSVSGLLLQVMKSGGGLEVGLPVLEVLLVVEALVDVATDFALYLLPRSTVFDFPINYSELAFTGPVELPDLGRERNREGGLALCVLHELRLEVSAARLLRESPLALSGVWDHFQSICFHLKTVEFKSRIDS
jgi:hypothetical protein